MIDAVGVHAADGYSSSCVPVFEDELKRCLHPVHGDIRNDDPIEFALRFHPGSRLQENPAKRIAVVERAVRKTSGAIDQTLVNQEIFRRSDEADPIARRVQQAFLDHHIVPIAAGNRIIAGVESAAADRHIPTGPSFATAKMNPVPSALDRHPFDIDAVRVVEQDRVVRRTLDAHIRDPDALALVQKNRVGAPHSLLPLGIEDIAPVDHSAAGDRHVLDVIAEQQRTVPAPWKSVVASDPRDGFVGLGIVVPQESGPGLDEKRHSAP